MEYMHYSGTIDDSTIMGALGALAGFGVALVGVLILIGLAVLIVDIIARWKLFEKMGQPGWAAIIPIYRDFVLARGTFKQIYIPIAALVIELGILLLPSIDGGTVSGILLLVNLILWVYIYVKLSKAFGLHFLYALVLLLFPTIGVAVLGFGKAKFIEAQDM